MQAIVVAGFREHEVGMVNTQSFAESTSSCRLCIYCGNFLLTCAHSATLKKSVKECVKGYSVRQAVSLKMCYFWPVQRIVLFQPHSFACAFDVHTYAFFVLTSHMKSEEWNFQLASCPKHSFKILGYHPLAGPGALRRGWCSWAESVALYGRNVAQPSQPCTSEPRACLGPTQGYTTRHGQWQLGLCSQRAVLWTWVRGISSLISVFCHLGDFQDLNLGVCWHLASRKLTRRFNGEIRTHDIRLVWLAHKVLKPSNKAWRRGRWVISLLMPCPASPVFLTRNVRTKLFSRRDKCLLETIRWDVGI